MKYMKFFLKISLTEKFKALEALVIISYCKPFFSNDIILDKPLINFFW